MEGSVEPSGEADGSARGGGAGEGEDRVDALGEGEQHSRETEAESSSPTRSEAEAADQRAAALQAEADADAIAKQHLQQLEDDVSLVKRLQKLLEKTEGQREAQAEAVAALEVPGVLLRLALQSQAGSRVVQTSLEKVDRATAVSLAAKLKGGVLQAIASSHANYVVQKVVQSLTPEETPFLLEEILQGRLLELACHEYGCRVFRKIVEHCAVYEDAAKVVDRIVWHADQLVINAYGHHVAERCLEKGLPHQRHMIVTALRWSLLEHAHHRNAAFLIVKALMVVEQEQREELTWQFAAELRSPQDLVTLVSTCHGQMVCRSVLDHALPDTKRYIVWLCAAAIQLKLKACKSAARFVRKHGGHHIVVFEL